MQDLIGQPLRRFEDHRFLTGRGKYVDDINWPGQVYAHIVRASHAHAKMREIDIAAAQAVPGVLGVFTAADLEGVGPIPCQVQVATIGPMLAPHRPALATGRVRFVGEPVAFVVAESQITARDAAELVSIDYASLPCVVDAREALAADAPLLWPDIPGNRAYTFEKGDREAVQAALAQAAHVVELDLVNNRIIVAAIEHRGALGSFDPATETYHLLLSAAGVHGIRDALADEVFAMPRERIRVSAPDVGGGFGVKNAVYPEYILLLWAARRLGRPVKWVSDHPEDFISTAHGRDNLTRARLGLAADGHFLALEVDTVANLGAAMSSGGPGSSTNAPGNALGGGYAIPAIFMHVRGAYTNTVPTDAYRGAGKPEVNYLLERLIDTASARLGVDGTALRRRNLIDAFPYRTPMATTIDGGRFAANIAPALAASDHAGFPGRLQQSAAKGMLRGIGITCFLETARGAPDEGAEVRFERDGTVTLLLGSQSNGQGHETSFPQVAAALLGLPIQTFRYVQADTALIPAGHGHGGARSLHQGGTALVRAAEGAIEKGRLVAARLLQAKPEQVQFAEGRYSVAGRSVGLLETAAEDQLDTYVWNKLDLITFPNGVHVAEVEVDPETGSVALLRYTAVDDFGRVVNPLLTIGQVHGGVAQGIGQAMLERTAYDGESGQLLSGTFMDYTLPRASDLPDLDIHLDGVPTNANPLGVKGAGQAGAMGAPQAVIGAILNALAPLGVTHLDMPATPERVWSAIQSVRPRSV